MMMLVTYSAKDGIVTGVKDTFSGDRPCALCRSIESAKIQTPAESESPVNLPSNSHPLLFQVMLPVSHDGLRERTASRFLPPGFSDRRRVWQSVVMKVETPPPQRDTTA